MYQVLNLQKLAIADQNLEEEIGSTTSICCHSANVDGGGSDK